MEEIAARLALARPSCRERQQPCANCKSEPYQGCFYLADAVLTPRNEEAIAEIFR